MRKYFLLITAAVIIAALGTTAKLVAEQGDYSTMGYNTVSGYSLWRVDSSGYLKPGVASTLDIGTAALPVRNIYAGGLVGATLTSGTMTSPTITGPSISGTAAFTGAITQVSDSGIQVSTASTSVYSVTYGGAVVTLSTQPARAGLVFLQTSDMTMWVSTRASVANEGTGAGTALYKGLTN